MPKQRELLLVTSRSFGLLRLVNDGWFLFLFPILCPETCRDRIKQTTESDNAFFRI